LKPLRTAGGVDGKGGLETKPSARGNLLAGSFIFCDPRALSLSTQSEIHHALSAKSAHTGQLFDRRPVR
jgi:hypothetical protein